MGEGSMSESRPKRRGGWLIAIGALIALVFLVIALLPALVSSQWGKGRVLALAAPSMPGEVQIDSWSLSWFGAQNIKGISYRDQAAGLRVDSNEVVVDKGLFSFLLDRGDVGTVTVVRPDIQYRLPEPTPVETTQDPAEAPDEQPAEKGVPPAPGDGGVTEKEALALPPISGLLIVKEGSIGVIATGNEVQPVAKSVNLEMDIASLADDITYSLSLAAPDGTGSLSGDGKVVLQGTDTMPGTIRPSGNLEIKDWNISQLLSLASQFAALPSGRGILESNVAFDGSLNDGIDLTGLVDLRNLELYGGQLGEDRPFLEQTSVEFTSVIGTDNLEISSLTLASPLASGSLKAAVASEGPLQFETDLLVDLQKVASQIPNTLNLQQGLEITGGRLALDGQLQSLEGENRFRGEALIEGLAGIRDGQKISLDKPFTLSLDGQQGAAGIRLDNFAVRSSFLEGEGQGDLNDLRLSLNADLGAALKEISKFIALQNYMAEGRLGLSLAAQRTDDATVSLEGQVDADNLMVKQGETVIIPRKPLKLSGTADILLTQDFEFSGVVEGSLAYQAWLGQGVLKARDLEFDGDQSIRSVGEVSTDSRVHLGDLGNMLKSLKVLPKPFVMTGESRLRAKVSGTDGRFLIDDLLIDSAKLSVREGDAGLVPESALTIEGSGAVTLGNDGAVRSVDNPQLSYESWLGSGTVQAASFDLASTTVKELAFIGKTNLARVAELSNVLELLPAGMTFSGLDSSSLTMDYSPEKIDLASLRTEIVDFAFTQEGKTYRDKKLLIEASGAVDMVQKSASFSPVQLNSANGAVALERLAVNDWSNPLDTLNSTGQARFDLPTILNAVADWFTLPPDVSTAATVDLNWIAEAQPGVDHKYRISADLMGFSLSKKELQAFTNENVQIEVDGLRNPTSGNMELNQFNIVSSLVDFDAAGFWNNTSGNVADFGFKGNLGMDLARIAALVRTFSEIDLEMAGKSARPFELKGTLSPEQRQQWWRHTDFNGSFQADLIRVLGVELSSLEIPVTANDGLALAELQGKVNQGGLLLRPQLDMRSEPPVLTIPENSLVLDQMQITRDMANQLLARIHPLFMGASQMSGTVDLNLERFIWPLGTESLNDLQFSGFMDFNEVRFESSALIGSLLQVLRVEETGIDLSGRQIRFEGKDGRITTNPLRTNLSDTELIISGSLGLDTTIDYLAQAEVTERLVGGDLYNYLEGTTINVPIGGTLSSPDISAQTVQRAVTDLVNQAGQRKLQEAAGDLLKRLF